MKCSWSGAGSWELGIETCWELEVGSLERCSRSGAGQCLDLELRNLEAEGFGGSGNWKLFQVESCGSCGSCGSFRSFASWELT